MTGDDNPLIDDDKTFADEIPSFPINDLRVFLAGLKHLGFNPDALMAAAGLRDLAMDDPDLRIPCDKFGTVIGCAMRTRPVKNVGVKIAASTSIGAFPLLDYLAVTSDTVGEAAKQLARYFRIVTTPIMLEVHEQEDPIRWMIRAPSSMSVEFSLSLDVLHLREETQGRFCPEWVSFTHKPDQAEEIEGILGCRVRSEASWNGLAVSREAWNLPLRRRDPILRGLLEQQANEIIARLPARRDIVIDVRRLLAKRIVGGDTRIDSVARELTTTARTLQRRLEQAGVSYQELLEETLREAAEQYLLDRSLPISEVAFLLGYSEPSAFHRAFKRWNNVTPLNFRQRRDRA
jgi:AraC-like DNA-binding protein